jgi:hypothetical protein
MKAPGWQRCGAILPLWFLKLFNLFIRSISRLNCNFSTFFRFCSNRTAVMKAGLKRCLCRFEPLVSGGGNGRQDFKVIKTTLIMLVLAAGLVNAACLTRADLQIGIMSSGLGYDGGQRAIHLAAKGY